MCVPHDLDSDGAQVAGIKGLLEGTHLIQHTPYGPHISLAIIRLALHKLVYTSEYELLNLVKMRPVLYNTPQSVPDHHGLAIGAVELGMNPQGDVYLCKSRTVICCACGQYQLQRLTSIKAISSSGG